MFKKVSLILSFMLFWQITSWCQRDVLFDLDYCKNLYRADSFHSIKSYDSALRYYRDIAYSNSVFREDRTMYVSIFECFRGKGQLDSAFYFVHRALEYGLHCLVDNPTGQCEIGPGYLVFDKKRNDLLARMYRENNRVNSFDSSLYKQIKAMIDNDQAARLTDDNLGDATGLNRDSLYGALRQVDGLNTMNTKAIIHKHGWPGYHKLGATGDNALWALVQHADQDVAFQEYVLKLIEASILENNTNRRNYAYLYDRICVNKGRPQVFGTQADRNADEIRPHPLRDKQNVNYYRHACGLESMEAYFEYFRRRSSNKNKRGK